MRNIFVGLLAFLLVISCTEKKKEKDDWVKSDFEFATNQLTVAIQEVEKAREVNAPDKVFPRTIATNGNLILTNYYDWTCGFFPGELWYMYEYSKDDIWKQHAELFTNALEGAQWDRSNHDLGFKIYCSFGNGYRLTGNEKYREVMLQAAQTLITRYKPTVGVIRSWDFNNSVWQTPVIIDNMMNLELLFWAFKETSDSTYYNIAVSHADKTMENHFRKDFSSYHVVDYDSITSQVLNKHTHQGYAHESAWARGQAWGAYGYTMCYGETKNPAYLQQAEEIIEFIFNNPNLPEDLIPYWDFDASGIPNEPRDVSAATIVASALYELSLYNIEKAELYRNRANSILTSLSLHYKATPGGDYGFLLLHSTGHKPGNSEIDAPIVYADYYFLEALLRKHKLETNQPLF